MYGIRISPEEQGKQIIEHEQAKSLAIKQAIKTANASFNTPEYQASLERSREKEEVLIKEIQEYDRREVEESITRVVKWLNFQLGKDYGALFERLGVKAKYYNNINH